MGNSNLEEVEPTQINVDDVIGALAFAGAHALPTLLTVAEAGGFLRLDRRTVRDMVRTGELAGNQRGHCIRITRESVVDWASGKRRAPRSKRFK